MVRCRVSSPDACRRSSPADRSSASILPARSRPSLGSCLCDEVTSGLDTVVGAAILELLAELRRELGLAYLFISHDLSTVRAVCDVIAIFYAGERVELASHQALRTPPLHPYADLLLASIPELRIGWLGEMASARAIAAGVAKPRCGARWLCVLRRAAHSARVDSATSPVRRPAASPAAPKSSATAPSKN